MLTAAVPTQEYYVLTDTGQTFVWSAADMNDLFRQLTERGHRATKVQLFTEYEADCANIECQQQLADELDRVIEKGDAA